MPNQIDVDKLLEALNINAEKAAESLGRFSNETDLATEKEREAYKAQQDVYKEFDNLGLILKKTATVEGFKYETLQKSEVQQKKRNKLDEDTIKILEQTQANFKSLTQSQKEEEISRMRSRTMLEQQLESMNKVIDKNGKITDLSTKMTQADQLRLVMAQRHTEAQKKNEAALGLATNSLMDLPKKLALAGLSFAFNRLIGSIDATYRGMVMLEDAQIEGRTGETVSSIVLREQMQAEADAHKELAGTLKDTGSSMVQLGASAILSGNPLAMLAGVITTVIGAFTWWKGREEEQTAKSIEYAKKRIEDQGKQSEKIFDGYEKLASASLIGSRGLEGLVEDLHKVGLTVNQFEKLNKVLQENQKDMRLFGAGAVDGAKNFAEQAGKLINSELGRELRAMGISQEEQMSHMANFMAMQAKTGMKASGDQAKAAANYIKELDKMAIITGQSRKEAEDAKKSLLSMNQLRAAILMAEKRGDTKELARLNNYLDTAVDVYKTDPEYAGAIAKYAASGVTDALTAKVAQDQGGKGGAIEMIESGQGTRAERLKAVATGVMRTEERFAETTRITGGVPGVTVGEGKLGEFMDLAKGVKKVDEAAEKAGKTLDEYTESQKKVAADAQKAADLRIKQQNDNIAKDNELRAGALDAAHSLDMQNAAAKSWYDTVTDTLGGWWKSMSTGLSNWWDQWQKDDEKYNADMYAKIDELTGKLKSGFTSMIDTITKSFDGMFDKIYSAINSLINLIPGAGAAIDKAKEVGGKAVDTVKGAASSAASSVGSFFGMSPSAPAPAAAPATRSGGGVSLPNSNTEGGRSQGAASIAPSSIGGGRGNQGVASIAPSSIGGGRGSQGVASANAELEKYATMTGGALAANITRFESGAAGYNAYNRGTIGNKMIGSDKPIDFSKMTIAEYLKHGNLNSGDPDKIFAMGKYQIIPSTMAGLVKKLKLNPETTFLDSDTQDLLFNEGILKQSRPNVAAYLAGRSNDRDAAILDMAKEFASVGVPYPAGKAKDRGESYYAGVGGNKAHNPPEAVGAALDSDRKASISASLEGIAKGPESGYSAQLHGTELIKRLTPNSILDQLANTPAASVAASPNQSIASDILMNLHELMESKFDSMISAIKDGNDISDKLLKYSQA